MKTLFSYPLMSSLYKYARDFEINQITIVQLRKMLMKDRVTIIVSYFFVYIFNRASLRCNVY